jgi:hypothetical protein
VSEQWPSPNPAGATPAPVGLGGAGHQDAQPLLPLAFTEHVELIKAGRAVDAFARRRAGQMISHGHTPEADLARSPAYLAKEAKDRLHAFLDYMGPRRMNLPPERREQLLRYIDTCGAMLIALRDRLAVEVPEDD